MSKSTGYGGNLAITGLGSTIDAHVRAWELDDDQDLHESTDFNDVTGYHHDLAGLSTAVVRASAYYDSSVAYDLTISVPEKAEATCLLTVISGKTITVVGHVRRKSPRVDKQTGVNVFDFELKGRVTASV